MKIKRKQKSKPQTRKELRKEKRQQKKKNRFNYHNVKKANRKIVKNSEKAHDKESCSEKSDEEILSENESAVSEEEHQQNPEVSSSDKLQKFLKREKEEHDEYFREIKMNRVEQLKKANEEEDKVIAKYEKLLKLNRRKKGGSTIGKFNDGLDYLLELCTDENIQKMYEAAKEVCNIPEVKQALNPKMENSDGEISDEIESVKLKSEMLKKVEEKYFGNDDEAFFNAQNNQLNDDDDESCDGDDSEIEAESNNGNASEENEIDSEENGNASEADDEELKEDIYGRKIDKQGNVVQDIKYVPPHMRKMLKEDEPERKEKLIGLKKQIKGYINRLAETNMHRIAIELEKIYSCNSRNDTNTILSEVILDSLVSNVLAKERLVLEHTLLVAILHGNVGSEVGAFLLQLLVKKFDELYQHIDDSMRVEDKQLDNVIFILSHLYTFKVFKLDLIYEILRRLSTSLTEKRIECILLILKSIGFLLRKDDPLLLKEFIVETQKQIQGTRDEEKNSRAAYLLDILMAVKNNNMTKIPQYDASLVEHFRKLLKQYIRSGNYVVTLAITMEDLLNAEEHGKWWLVGSAWSGATVKNKVMNEKVSGSSDEKREKIYALAKKQRMNTDTKRHIFYLLMVAEDYIDAFEKIISTSKDERTIIGVILHCCLSESSFNKFYAVLIRKFCEHSRKFLLALQFAVWDKIKDLESVTSQQLNNLSRFLAFLIENGTLPLSVLKVVEFGQIEKATLLFMRKLMLLILMSDEDKFRQIFERIAPSIKLHTFKDQLRLFLKVFLLKNDNMKLGKDQLELIKTRVQLAEKYLCTKE